LEEGGLEHGAVALIVWLANRYPTPTPPPPFVELKNSYTKFCQKNNTSIIHTQKPINEKRLNNI
jgi:hypothetical protein